MEKIRTLTIDIESRSSADLGKCGVYKYAESPDFDILLFVVSVDEGPVKVYDLLCGDHLPEDILEAIAGTDTIKYSYNAGFERICVEKHGQNAELRQKGKQAVLSCSYGGSVGALKAMGAVEAGMREEELQPLVDAWREANPHIVQFWWDLDRAIKLAVKDHTPSKIGCIDVYYRSGMLFIQLPSGRTLAYAKPQIGMNRFGNESVTYMGLDSTKKWSRIESFPGKWAENITQSVSRDILCYAMNTLRDCRIVAHVHDEVIIECLQDASVEEVCEKMGRTPDWIPGLSLKADGYECVFYKKS